MEKPSKGKPLAAVLGGASLTSGALVLVAGGLFHACRSEQRSGTCYVSDCPPCDAYTKLQNGAAPAALVAIVASIVLAIVAKVRSGKPGTEGGRFALLGGLVGLGLVVLGVALHEM